MEANFPHCRSIVKKQLENIGFTVVDSISKQDDIAFSISNDASLTVVDIPLTDLKKDALVADKLKRVLKRIYSKNM
jgi:hypothetical protein